MSVERIQHRLRTFASTAAARVSPLYAHLAEAAADDVEVAGLLTAAEDQFATPTLLFAAAQRMLQAEPFHELTNYYATLGGAYGVDAGTWPMWRSFVLQRAEKTRELIATHTTQTNEVRRAAQVYPAVALAAREARGPVALLEVGCSAGLLLGLDRYSYRYQVEQAGQVTGGPAKAPLGLHCALHLGPGATVPDIPRKLSVGARIGLDRSPVDLADEDAAAWLEACIWADQPDRTRLFLAAAALQRRDPPELVVGDAVDDLAATVDRLPAGMPVVVLTSLALLYLPDPRRREFIAALAGVAAGRPLWWVSHEEYRAAMSYLVPGRADLVAGPGEPSFGVVGLVNWVGGEPVARALATSSWHGERLRWLV